MRPNLYDYLKIIALVTMILDHIGFSFYPDVELFRIIGRTAFPIFLFLVWYNHSYAHRSNLWFWGIILQIFLRIWARQWIIDFWYANILLWIWAVRMLLQWLKSLNNRHLERIIWVLALVYAPMTQAYVDYGTLLIVFGMVGYWVKKRWWSFKSWIVILTWVIYHVLFMWDLYWFTSWWRLLLWGIWVFLWASFLLLSKKNYSLVVQQQYINNIVIRLSAKSLIIYVIQAVLIGFLLIIPFR